MDWRQDQSRFSPLLSQCRWDHSQTLSHPSLKWFYPESCLKIGNKVQVKECGLKHTLRLVDRQSPAVYQWILDSGVFLILLGPIDWFRLYGHQLLIVGEKWRAAIFREFTRNIGSVYTHIYDRGWEGGGICYEKLYPLFGLKFVLNLEPKMWQIFLHNLLNILLNFLP